MDFTASFCYKIQEKITLEGILCVLDHLSFLLKALRHFGIYDPQFMTGVLLESDKMEL